MNHNNNNSVIPPVARRKLQMRAQRQQAQRLANLMWAALLCLSLIGFWIYHHHHAVKKNYQRRPASVRNRYDGTTPRLRGAKQPWINQSSLPFVSKMIICVASATYDSGLSISLLSNSIYTPCYHQCRIKISLLRKLII
jgi:hypothetical protein